MKQIRQGDILLLAVDVQPPVGLKPVSEVILAKGELTGHNHVLTGQVYEWERVSQRYVQVEGEHTLSHPDHDPAPVSVMEPGIAYAIIPQQEWNLSGQWRKVID